MNTVRLQADSISFRYRETAPFIFENISFEIKEGEVLALLGRNGVGKSTLLNCLMGFLSVHTGSVKCNGRDIRNLSMKERATEVAFVPQIIGSEITYTVRDYISFGATARTGMFSAPSKAEFEEVDTIIDTLGLTNIAYRQCRDLSGGQRQLAAIGRALMQNTKVLLMDEPMSALDVGNQVLVLQTIDALRLKGYAIIITTHLPEQAILLKSRIGLCFGEHIELYNSMEEVTAEKLEEVYHTKLELFYSDIVNRMVCVIPHL